MPKVSFQEGTEARKAASVVAEDLKEKPRSAKADNVFALSRYITKRMSPSKRRAVASRRLA